MMMKNPDRYSVLKLFLMLTLLSLSSIAHAHDFEVDGIFYNINGNTVTVTYRGTSYSQFSDEYLGNVTIPASVSYGGVNYSVTSIGVNAFNNCSKLTGVIIPNSVTTIGYEAFAYCSGLKSVTIPNSITTISEYAFRNCSNLTSVHIFDLEAWCNISFGSNPLSYAHHLYLNGTEVSDVVIPNNINTIGNNTFSGCTGLASVTIPSSVTTIGNSAFSGCTGLASVTIPNSVTTIGNSAFYRCTGLGSATIGNSVTSIGGYAFSGCGGLTNLTIPNSVTTIGNSAFNGCTGLGSVTIGNSVTSIGDYAFSGCRGLTSLTIPNSVTSIGEKAFFDCSGLSRIIVSSGNAYYDSRNNCEAIIETGSNTLLVGCNNSVIPNTITSIDNYAFYNCNGLTSINIPNSVTNIGSSVFSGCSGLASIAVSGGNANYDSRNNCNAIIETSSNTLLVGCKNTVIPNTVTSIGKSAFYGCTELINVAIPGSLTSIGDYAFYDCCGLKDVYSDFTNPSMVSMGSNVFRLVNSNYSNRTLHVPAGSAAEYQTNASWWPFFGAIVDMDNEYLSLSDGLLWYTLTSDSTVMVTGQSLMDIPSYYGDDQFMDYDIKIVIPDHITYNNKDYIVSAIGDSVFYNNNYPLGEDCYIYYYLEITIPETVTSIGYGAFGGYSIDMINVICLAKNPPIMNDSFICYGDINLFVPAEAYTLYQELNSQNHFCSSIYVTDGERSEPPLYNEITLEQPVSYPYGWVVKIYPSENSVVYAREDYNDTGLYNHVSTGGWVKYENSDSLYYYYTSQDYWGAKPDGWMVEFMLIEEGKSPSYVCKCGNLNVEFLDNKWWESFDFIDTDIGYNIIGDSVGVTFQAYTDPREYYKKSNSANNTYMKASITNGKSVDVFYFEADEIIYYFGDVVIPRTATYHKYDNYTPNHVYYETYTTYPVTSIGWYAFKDCFDLNSVVLPQTITLVEEEAFTSCPNLTFIKCQSRVPPTAIDESFDEGIYQNTTLYVPMPAVEAYRNAPGWCEFQHIVGFYDYDFEQDGLYFKKTGDGEVVVTCGENPYSGNVTIPASVTEQGVTYSVTGIGDGAFTGAEIDALYLPVTITTIGEGAFTDSHIHSLYITGSGAWSASGLGIGVDNLYVGSGVNGMAGMQVSASAICSYATVPPACDDQTFLDYNAELHVPAASVAAYFTAPYWCNFININGDAVELISITLNDVNVEVLVGGQATLTATLNPANAMPDSIIWESSNEAVATVDAGMVTGIAAGECDIVAICQNKRATCHVTVTEILPTSITLNQETAKLEVGSQLALTATLQPDDVTMTTVSWATTDSTVATVADGVVTAVGAGECTITATCGELQAQCHIIVVEHLIYITLDEHEATVVPNHIITLTPTVTPVSTDLVVTSSNPSVAAARMANGKVQVVGISEGETVIRLQSADGYAEPDSCYVIVYTEVGDVNRDGYVNLADVVGLINYLLQGNSGQYSFENADVNHDNGVNVGDLSLLISYLLGGVDLEPNDPVNPSRSFTVNGVTFKMMRVTGGTFQMGATVEMDSDAGADESPVHDVTLSTYYMGQTEVTQELWQAVMGTNPSYYTGDLQRPVDKVSYSDCEAFIAQLNELTGQNFRLPTEAEWEFAARGGNRSHHYLYSGSNDATEVAWCTTTSDGTTHPVATKRPNELGIYDMSGNVCEWCGEWYSLYPEEPQVDPTGPETGRSRVHRGGSLQFLEKNCTVTRRNYFSPGIVRSYMGLRLVL